MSPVALNTHGLYSSPALDRVKQTPGENPFSILLLRTPDRDSRTVPELIPPVLVVTTEIEASKRQAAWAAVDRHILPQHTVSSSIRFYLWTTKSSESGM